MGDYGKGVDKVFQKLVKTGHHKTTERLYKTCRHEILNELNKEDVTADLIRWIRQI